MHERYAAFASHYRFDPKFCMPASGWEKPHVENRVYDLQRRWATPVPTVGDLDELNGHLRRCCLAEMDRTVAGQSETIGERFEQEKAAALSLPAYGFDPCVTAPAKVDHYQRMQYDKARYSVPRSSEAAVTVKAYPDRVQIVSRGQVVARHRRRYDGGQELDPLHYLVTLGRRPAALDHSNVYRRWDLPAVFGELRAKLEQRHGESIGVRQYIRVLQLLSEHPMERVRRAIEDVRFEAALDDDRVRRRAEHLAARDTAREVHDANDIPDELAQVEVPLPDLSRFDQFLTVRSVPHPRRTRPMSDTSAMLLKTNLKRLRLPTISAKFQALAREAAAANEDYAQYLLRLTELEVAARQSNALKARIKQAGFPVHKDFDTYDFSAMPSLNKPKILELEVQLRSQR